MDAIQTQTSEISQLIKGNTIYTSYQEHWKFMLESYLGGQEYRDAHHLTRYQLETSQEYAARIRATPVENHCASVVSVYNSFIFRESPERTFGLMDGLPEVEEFLRDADLDGRSLDAFMKDVSTWSNVYGHCWIIVAKPNVGAVTRADEQIIGVRPYVSLLTPLTVLDWHWTRDVTGRYVLDYLRYLEDVNGDVSVVKEWTPDFITTSTVDAKNNIIMEQMVEPNQLGMVPAICAYNRRSGLRGIGISSISDIAMHQKLIYNNTSEVYQSILMDSHPSLVVTPECSVGTGAGAIIKIDPNMDAGLKPYVLDFAGANIGNIYQSIQHSINAIDKMANTGAVRATESRTMSGVAMETEFALLNARLSESADNLELAEEQMWKIWSMYMGYDWSGEIDYPGSFNIRDNGSEIAQLQTAKSAATDARVIAAIDAKILDWLDLDLDELAAIANNTVLVPDAALSESEEELFSVHWMTDPTTGERVQVTTQDQHMALTAQGYLES